MMDIERIRDKLSEIKVYLIELDEDIPEDKGEYLEERVTRRACERTFQLACEDVIDICNLIIAGKVLGLPKDNRDAIRKLADNKIISEKLSAKLEDMVSFRNLLVHRYGNVDDSRAYSYLKDEMDDLYQFTMMIEKLIES
ncbi:MAG: DUF86 domain-containing protein [Candidatus Methanoperedens sp.]|nr:DUF86 domain-containing protein [Candidatus Methanoperedens sp.]